MSEQQPRMYRTLKRQKDGRWAARIVVTAGRTMLLDRTLFFADGADALFWLAKHSERYAAKHRNRYAWRMF